MAARLSPQQIDEALSALPAWSLVEEGSAIRRELRFAGFDEAMAFIVALAEVARALDHHGGPLVLRGDDDLMEEIRRPGAMAIDRQNATSPSLQGQRGC